MAEWKKKNIERARELVRESQKRCAGKEGNWRSSENGKAWLKNYERQRYRKNREYFNRKCNAYRIRNPDKAKEYERRKMAKRNDLQSGLELLTIALQTGAI